MVLGIKARAFCLLCKHSPHPHSFFQQTFIMHQRCTCLEFWRPPIISQPLHSLPCTFQPPKSPSHISEPGKFQSRGSLCSPSLSPGPASVSMATVWALFSSLDQVIVLRDREKNKSEKLCGCGEASNPQLQPRSMCDCVDSSWTSLMTALQEISHRSPP